MRSGGLIQLCRRSLHTRLRRPVSVAPMVKITTPQFLELLHIISGSERYDYYTEMYHSQAITHHADHLDRFVGKPRSNVVVQLGGSDPDNMAQAARILQDHGYHQVNINVGCPSQSVQHGQFGAVLMKKPDLVAEILSTMDKYHVTIPVTVKCRIGIDAEDSFEFLYNFVNTLHICSRPPPHLIVHARKCILKGLSPKQNRIIPPLNYDRVYELASAFPQLPITINGGYTETQDIKVALDRVDGCMIGRKVMDHPLFLQDIEKDIYNTKHVKSTDDILNEYLDYADRLLSLKLEKGDYGLPPLTLMVKPLMALYHGRTGRHFRQIIFDQLKQSPSDFGQVVRAAVNESKLK
ncbi:dihydrouridine synthase, partial [Backusella circina FSU 941]